MQHKHGTSRWKLGAAVTLGALGVLTLASPLAAQARGGDRPSGDYSVVGGSTLGSHANVIYILDAANRELVALRWNDSTKALEGIGYRDLVADLSGETER